MSCVDRRLGRPSSSEHPRTGRSHRQRESLSKSPRHDSVEGPASWELPSKYPRELHERAVRMVAELRPDHPSEYVAMTAVAGDPARRARLLPGAARAVRRCSGSGAGDDPDLVPPQPGRLGRTPRVRTEAAAEGKRLKRLKRLKRENTKLRRANEMSASAFFAAELDRPQEEQSCFSGTTTTVAMADCGEVSSRSATF